MKSNAKIIVFYLVLIAAILIAASALFSEPASDKLMYSDIVDLFENEQVDSFVVK